MAQAQCGSGACLRHSQTMYSYSVKLRWCIEAHPEADSTSDAPGFAFPQGCRVNLLTDARSPAIAGTSQGGGLFSIACVSPQILCHSTVLCCQGNTACKT
ncbi:unnamed protein product [Discosporangium mesarthrocarpum]